MRDCHQILLSKVPRLSFARLQQTYQQCSWVNVFSGIIEFRQKAKRLKTHELCAINFYQRGRIAIS